MCVFSQSKTDTLSIEQALTTYSTGAPVFSPDGSKAVVVVSQSGLGESLPLSHIWLVDVAAKTIRQFTSSQKSESSPKWSPDGKNLAFLSARNGESQLFLMDMGGGEALQLTHAKTAISSFEWSPVGQTIAYVAEDTATSVEKNKKANNYDERVVSESSKATNVFTINVADKHTMQLSSKQWQIEEMKWMQAGNALLLVAQPLPEKEIAEKQLLLLSLSDTSITHIPCPNHPFWGNVNISPDGNVISYVSARTDGPTAHDFFLQPVKGGIAKNITEKTLDLPVGNVKFVDNNHVLALVTKGFSSKLMNIDNNGKAVDYGINRNVGTFDISANGTLIFQSFGGA
jgi:Tol biopolymer transport system component